MAAAPEPAAAQQSGDAEAALAARASTLLNLVRDRVPGCEPARARRPLARPIAWVPDAPDEDAPDTLATSRSASVPPRPFLRWQPRLATAAERHTAAMARHDFFDHVDPWGRTVAQRVGDTGYAWRVVGETLASGQASLEEALRDWLASPAHCAALLDGRFTEFGIARVAQPLPGAPDAALWTLVLGRPAGTR